MSVGYSTDHLTQQGRVMYIDSRDATHVDGTAHFSYTFKDALVSSPNEGILVSLLSATVPYSFYNIRANVNDKLYFTVDNAAQRTVTLPPGNYTSATLGTELSTRVTQKAQEQPALLGSAERVALPLCDGLELAASQNDE